MHEKSQVVEALAMYINEVERQLERKWKSLDQIEVMNIMESMMNQGNVQAHLQNSLKSMAFVHNRPRQEHHNKMV